jgi:hypothetical protein
VASRFSASPPPGRSARGGQRGAGASAPGGADATERGGRPALCISLRARRRRAKHRPPRGCTCDRAGRRGAPASPEARKVTHHAKRGPAADQRVRSVCPSWPAEGAGNPRLPARLGPRDAGGRARERSGGAAQHAAEQTLYAREARSPDAHAEPRSASHAARSFNASGRTRGSAAAERQRADQAAWRAREVGVCGAPGGRASARVDAAARRGAVQGARRAAEAGSGRAEARRRASACRKVLKREVCQWRAPEPRSAAPGPPPQLGRRLGRAAREAHLLRGLRRATPRKSTATAPRAPRRCPAARRARAARDADGTATPKGQSLPSSGSS